MQERKQGREQQAAPAGDEAASGDSLNRLLLAARRARAQKRKAEGAADAAGEAKALAEDALPAAVETAKQVGRESGAVVGEPGSHAPPAEADAHATPGGHATHAADPNTGSTKDFKDEKVLSSTPTQVQLGLAGGAAYSAATQERRVDSMNRTETLSIVFHNVDQATFERLKTAYSGWSKAPSQASFEKLSGGKSVIPDVPIETFLPPLMQALLDKAFTIQHFSDGTDATTNCWSTAYEVERQAETGAGDYTLFFADGAVKSMVMDDKWSTLVAQHKLDAFGKMDPAERAKTIHPGDSILLFAGSPNPNVLQHEVVVLDGDLVFEKPSYDGNQPFRLNTFEGLLTEYTGCTAQVRRWSSANPLPQIMEYMESQKLVEKSGGGAEYFDNGGSHGPDIIGGHERPQAFKIEMLPNGMATLVPAPSSAKKK